MVSWACRELGWWQSRLATELRADVAKTPTAVALSVVRATWPPCWRSSRRHDRAWTAMPGEHVFEILRRTSARWSSMRACSPLRLARLELTVCHGAVEDQSGLRDFHLRHPGAPKRY